MVEKPSRVPRLSASDFMCPVCAGILVQFQPETVSSFIWNSCPVSTGNLVQFRPEYALVLSKELKPLSSTKISVVFLYEDVARYAKRLKKKRLANLKKIARACEEIGMYEEQDAEALQAHSESEFERVGVATGKFEAPEPDTNLDSHIQDLFFADKQEPPK